jgi:hypothetical protein
LGLYVMEVVFRWLIGSGKSEAHFVDEVAGGDGVLSPESRKPIVTGRGVSLSSVKAEEHERARPWQDLGFKAGDAGTSAGEHWRVLSFVGLVAALCSDLLFKTIEAIGQFVSIDHLGDVGDQLRESRRFIHRDLACR